MNNLTDLDGQGVFDARYLAFLETITTLRPRLHRYCARMTGSSLDGEDVVQEALFQAYRKLDSFTDDRPLEPWLFRIAHNRCIDFLRRKGVRLEAEAEAGVEDRVDPAEPLGPALGHAVEHLVLVLPPKERACILLKDVFDYSLEEIADLVESTVGGVKAALSRGRAKLAATQTQPSRAPTSPASAELHRILQLYVERFNRRDWDGLRELISADARLLVADRFAGRLVDSPYFSRYDTWSVDWRLALGELDSEIAIVIQERTEDQWSPMGVVRLELAGGRISRVGDYHHCPWILASVNSIRPAPVG